MKHQDFSRVVCCQGTIQLAVAIHILQHRERTQFANSQPAFKNFLIVYDLFSPANQEKVFFETIKRMAQTMLNWESIIYLEPHSLDHFEKILEKDGKHSFDKEMGALLGVTNVDEVYASRNWQKGNLILLNLFSNAFKICYGDSIGLYFKETYFSNTDWVTRFRLSAVGKWVTSSQKKFKTVMKFPSRRPILKTLIPRNFDYGYFCFPGISDQHPHFRYEVLPVSKLKITFEEFAKHISVPLPENLPLTGNLSVLLTSNFSEAGRMSLEDELNAYIQFIDFHQKEKGIILIKPHPRDSKEKIDLLKRRFIDNSFSVFVLDDPLHFYLPFEFLLIKFELMSPGIIQKIKFFTVSSACLSIWFLFHSRPYIGLGAQLVEKYFQPKQVKGRLDHEKDLKTLVESVS